MLIRALTALGDWTFGRGKANYASEERAIEQNIATRIRSWQNDCFFDFKAGIDWVTRLDKGQRDNLVNDLKILLIQTYGVMRINAVTVVEDPATRHLVITYNVDTIYSESFTRAVAAAAGATVGS